MDRFDTARMEAFSDGVIAIAITLLVLELSIPPDEFHDLLGAILDQWPSYLAYVTSFITIGVVWLLHHAIFRRMAYADHTVIRLNLILLMATSFLPFPTKLLAESIHDADAERTAVLFYGGVLFAISSLIAAICAHVASRPELLAEGVTPDDARALGRRVAPSLGFYLLAFAAAILTPRLAAFGFLAIAVMGLWVTTREDRPSATAVEPTPPAARS
jgi:uncharacterized membrane protein